MAAPLLLPLVAWQAVATGNRAYIDLPIDRDFETINITAVSTGQTDAANVVNSVRVVVNGIAVRELTPAEIRYLNKKYGAVYDSADTGNLTLNFKEDWLWNHTAADNLALFTGGLLSLRIEVDVKTGLTAPVLGGYAIAKPQRAYEKGTNRVRKTKTDTVDFTGASTRIVRTILPQGLCKAFNLASSAVTAVKMRISGTEVFNMTKAQVDDAMKMNEQTPASGFFTMPFDLDGTFEGGLVSELIKEVELEITTSGAANVKVIQEYYEPIN